MFPSSGGGRGVTTRPSSALSNRPSSSLSQNRPNSALSSHRPLSRASTIRPALRHANSRIVPLCRKLVEHIRGQHDGPSEENQDESAAIEYAVRNLETTTITKAAASTDMDVVEKRILGHAEKARINSLDKMAEAIQTCLTTLKAHTEQMRDLDNEINVSRLADHLQFLLSLSYPSSPYSVSFADSYLEDLQNPKQGPKPLIWEDIIADEPFEGDHWKGVYGLPSGFVKSSEDENDSDSSSSSLISPRLRYDADFFRDEPRPIHTEVQETNSEPQVVSADPSGESSERVPHDSRHLFEKLRQKQYWHLDWRGTVNLDRPFNIADPSTLGPSFERILANEKGPALLESFQRLKYINEEDAVREVLLCLQGRRNILLHWVNNQYEPTETTPRLLHLTLNAEHSILHSFAETATTVRFLRSFSSSVLAQSQANIAELVIAAQSQKVPNESASRPLYRTTRTLESFAAAIDDRVRLFDTWCAAREEALCLGLNNLASQPIVVSLLSTEKLLESTFRDGFRVALDITRSLCTLDGTLSISSYWPLSMRPPAKTTKLLLDSLLDASRTYTQRGDMITASFMMDLFIEAAEPTWKLVGEWLRDGTSMTDQIPDEFFIERNDLGMRNDSSMLLVDPDFWEEGYTLRQGDFDFSSLAHEADPVPKTMDGLPSVPRFLATVADMLLASGKAMGLLRVMGMSSIASGKSMPPSFEWLSFRDVVGNDGSWSGSPDGLGLKVGDVVRPFCQASDEHLARVVLGECGLIDHLNTIEDLFLMKCGDVVTHFLDILFAKMDSQKSWADFHVLNTAFSDAMLTQSTSSQLKPNVIRFSYSKNVQQAQRSIMQTVQTLNGLQTEYAVPFPLHYILSPRIVQLYSDIFVFMVKVRRAKAVLDRILFREEVGAPGRPKLDQERKMFFIMRSRLSWFINTLLNYITTHVFHVELSRFHPVLSRAKSLDEMIDIHTAHIEKLQLLCLLNAKDSALHHSIISILDLALRFALLFTSFTGMSQELSVSQSFKIRHHSRQLKQQRRNVIVPTFVADDISEDDDDDGEHDASFPSFVVDHEDPSSIGQLSDDLHSLVKFVKRGVEALAGETGEQALTFGILAFDLEDWDH